MDEPRRTDWWKSLIGIGVLVVVILVLTAVERVGLQEAFGVLFVAAFPSLLVPLIVLAFSGGAAAYRLDQWAPLPATTIRDAALR